jgi:hypothetical protein
MIFPLSEEGGAGLGTLGFSVPVATKLVKEGGFESIDVISERNIDCWFLVRQSKSLNQTFYEMHSSLLLNEFSH